MKILFITPYIPSDMSGHAGPKLMYRNILSLSRSHQITLASFIDSNEQNMATILEDSGIEVHTVNYPRNQKSMSGKLASGIHNISPMISYLKGDEPFFFAKYNKKEMKNLISRLITNNAFDLVQVEYNVMHHYSALFENTPSVIVFHDVSTKVHERGQSEGNTYNKRSYEIAKKIEADIANKFDGVVTLTQEDQLYLKKLGCIKEIHVIPPQVKILEKIDVQKVPNTICFVGSFNREPNVHAVELLINDIYSIITVPVVLNIVGKDLPSELQKQINEIKGINYLGFIDDIDQFLASQMLMIAPIQIGAGLKMKIPHALASGTAVITTPVGAEGIAINSENGLWVCNSKRNMVDKINEVLGQDALLKVRGEAGKTAVRSLFSESMIIAKFEALYKQLVHT